MFIECLLCARHSAKHSLFASLNKSNFHEGEKHGTWKCLTVAVAIEPEVVQKECVWFHQLGGADSPCAIPL